MAASQFWGSTLVIFAGALGCGSSGSRSGDGPPAPPAGDVDKSGDLDTPGDGRDPNPTPDYAVAGSYSVDVASQSQTLVGCVMNYTRYVPSGAQASETPLVILAHGFLRSPARMADLGRHLATWGFEVNAVDLCSNTDHAGNGEDMAAFASARGGGRAVVQAGYSAGGLSALVAASLQASTAAYLGLDPVESGGAGGAAAADVSAPSYGLIGAAGACNSQASGAGMVGAITGSLVTGVSDAGHCDFEGPTDAVCELGCGGRDASRASLIRALATAFLRWQLMDDLAGADWVQPTGAKYQELLALGLIEP